MPGPGAVPRTRERPGDDAPPAPPGGGGRHSRHDLGELLAVSPSGCGPRELLAGDLLGGLLWNSGF